MPGTPKTPKSPKSPRKHQTRRRRRGALKPSNAAKIRGVFHRPPLAPGTRRRPAHSAPVQHRPRVIYANNIDISLNNIANMREADMNRLLRLP